MPRPAKTASEGDKLCDLKSNIRPLAADSSLVRACAVDEFDLGTSNPTTTFSHNSADNPFQWDLHSLVMGGKQHQHQNDHQHKPQHQQDQQVFSDAEGDDEDVSDDEELRVFPLDDEMNLSFITSFPFETQSLQKSIAPLNTVNTVDLSINSVPELFNVAAEDEEEDEEEEDEEEEPVVKARATELQRAHEEDIDDDLLNGRKRVKRIAARTLSESTHSSSTVSTPAQTPVPSSSGNGSAFVCSICQTEFTVKGYLTRHMKKHSAQKPFVCPFYDADSDSKCHVTGGFSRRDTFKTHLKALHFVYPTGTRCGERGDKSGRCAGCFEQFASNAEWLNKHVATNKCPSTVTAYK